MEAMPRGIPGDPVSEAGSEAAVRWSSYNVFHHIFLAEQTSIKGLLCLLYIRKKKCLGILLSGNTAKATKFLSLPFPPMLSAGVSVLQQKQTSKQAIREHDQEACSTARLYNSDSHRGWLGQLA